MRRTLSLDSALRQIPVFHCVFQRGRRFLWICRAEQHVNACLDRTARDRSVRIEIRHSLHLKPVRDDHTVKAKLLPQQFRYDLMGKWRRLIVDI